MEAFGYAESGSQGGGDHSCAGGGSDEGEGGEVEFDGFCVGAFADQDIDFEIFHGLVEAFFDDAVEAVDFVYEQDVALFEVGE